MEWSVQTSRREESSIPFRSVQSGIGVQDNQDQEVQPLSRENIIQQQAEVQPEKKPAAQPVIEVQESAEDKKKEMKEKEEEEEKGKEAGGEDKAEQEGNNEEIQQGMIAFSVLHQFYLKGLAMIAFFKFSTLAIFACLESPLIY